MPTPAVAPFPRSHPSLGSNPCWELYARCKLGASSAQATRKLARLDTHIIAPDVAQASHHGHPQPDGARSGIWEAEEKGLRWGGRVPKADQALQRGVWGRIGAGELFYARGREIAS